MLKSLNKKCKQQRGDTIIEVLLAMSVIGVVLGSAFGIANRSVATGRDAQERSEALKIAETQLELLKVYYPLEPSIAVRSSAFCIDESKPGGQITANASSSSCQDKNPSGGSGFYSVSIEPPANDSAPYAVSVTWPRINTSSNEPGNVTLLYRVGAL